MKFYENDYTHIKEYAQYRGDLDESRQRRIERVVRLFWARGEDSGEAVDWLMSQDEYRNLEWDDDDDDVIKDFAGWLDKKETNEIK